MVLDKNTHEIYMSHIHTYEFKHTLLFFLIKKKTEIHI